MKLNHLDDRGRARMVDVGGKDDTARIAVAEGKITMKPSTLRMITEGGAPKGDTLQTARLAGIMAAKKTPELIPLCHNIVINFANVELETDEENSAVNMRATVGTNGKTGVEMEALTAVSVAALTVYDMLKAVDRGMVISDIGLIEKKGGKSGHFLREGHSPSHNNGAPS